MVLHGCVLSYTAAYAKNRRVLRANGTGSGVCDVHCLGIVSWFHITVGSRSNNEKEPAQTLAMPTSLDVNVNMSYTGTVARSFYRATHSA